MTQAQSSLEFIPPAYNPFIWQIAKRIIPFWLRYNHHIVRVEVDNPEKLIDLYAQFQQEKMRFMMAFRHPSVIDPPCLAQLLWNQLPQLAQQTGVNLRSPVHTHFIYDRGIPLWAGDQVGWGIAKLGGTPIRRGAVDRVGLRSIRDLYVNGKFPMAAAPEGATNGHNEIVSPIEPGIAQFGFWCQEDLIKANRDEAVAIAPIGIRYFYQTAPWQYLDELLTKLEADSGLPSTAHKTQGLINGKTPSDSQEREFYQRLITLAEHLLSLMEDFYRKFYQQQLETADQALPDRLQALLDAALNVAEKSLALNPMVGLAIAVAAWNKRAGVVSIVKISPN